MAEDLEDDLPLESELDAEDDEEVLDPAGEPEDAEDDEVDAAPEKPEREAKPARSSGRVQRLAEERKRLSEELATARREADELRRRIPAQQAEDPRVEQERLALMSPEDRSAYQLDKALRANRAETQQMLFQMQQNQDKTAFDLKAKDDPVYRRFAADVEREYQKVISQGRYAPREDILKYLVGQRALEKRGQPNAKAAMSRAKQAGKPVSAKGDAPRRSGKFDLNTPEGRIAAFESQWGDRPISSF
jgi:hypothetical protein